MQLLLWRGQQLVIVNEQAWRILGVIDCRSIVLQPEPQRLALGKLIPGAQGVRNTERMANGNYVSYRQIQVLEYRLPEGQQAAGSWVLDGKEVVPLQFFTEHQHSFELQLPHIGTPLKTLGQQCQGIETAVQHRQQAVIERDEIFVFPEASGVVMAGRKQVVANTGTYGDQRAGQCTGTAAVHAQHDDNAFLILRIHTNSMLVKKQPHQRTQRCN